MNESEEYIANAIRTWIWSGFYGETDVHRMIADILEEDADEGMLRSLVAPEFERKAAAEDSWPARTDCDRLDSVFHNLNSDRIIALHNAGYTMSDGLDDVGEELHTRGRDAVDGYCFYHGQDVERVLASGDLWIAFGDLDDDSSQKTTIGDRIRRQLEQGGFVVEWGGDPETRLAVKGIEWKRRSPGCHLFLNSEDSTQLGPKYQVFYCFYDNGEHVDSGSPIPFERKHIIQRLVPRLTSDGDFLGLVDENGTTLQMMYHKERNTFWLEIPVPEDSGSYGAFMDRESLLSVLNELPPQFNPKDFPQFKFQSYLEDKPKKWWEFWR